MTKILLLLAIYFLFIVILVKKSYDKGAAISIVPPAIFDRLITYNAIAFISTNTNALVNHSTITLYIDNKRNVKVNLALAAINVEPRIVCAWLMLKDI